MGFKMGAEIIYKENFHYFIMVIRGKVLKFLKYILAGSFQFIGDLFLLWFFTEVIGLYYLISASIGVSISSLIGYTLNKKYVFKKSKRGFFEGFSIFLMITTGKIFAITAFLFLFVSILQINYLIARIITGIIIVLLMYILHTKVTYKTDFN